MWDTLKIPFILYHLVRGSMRLPTFKTRYHSQVFFFQKLSHCANSHKHIPAKQPKKEQTVQGVDRMKYLAEDYGHASCSWKREEWILCNLCTHQGMSLYMLPTGEQLATDVTAKGAYAWVDDQVPLECAPVLGDVVTVGALELIDG